MMLNVPVNGNEAGLLGTKILYSHGKGAVGVTLFVCIAGFFVSFMMAVIINNNTSNEAVLAAMWSIVWTTLIALIVGFGVLCFAYCPSHDDITNAYPTLKNTNVVVNYNQHLGDESNSGTIYVKKYHNDICSVKWAKLKTIEIKPLNTAGKTLIAMTKYLVQHKITRNIKATITSTKTKADVHDFYGKRSYVAYSKNPNKVVELK